MGAQEVFKAVVLVAVATAVHVSLVMQPKTVLGRLPVVVLVLPPHYFALRHIVFTVCEINL